MATILRIRIIRITFGWQRRWPAGWYWVLGGSEIRKKNRPLGMLVTAWVAGSAQVGAQTPQCADCSWTLDAPFSAVESAGDPDLWFGKILGLEVTGSTAIVADVYRHVVLRGRIGRGGWTVIGRSGEGPGEFRSPALIATHPDGGFFVFDFGLYRVSRFDREGRFQSSFRPSITVAATSMVVDDTGSLYIAGRSVEQSKTGVVHRFSAAGQYQASFGEASTAPIDALVQQQQGGSMWFDRETRALWLSRRGPRLVVERYALDGTLTHKTSLDAEELSVDDGPTVRRVEGGRVLVTPPPTLGTIAVFPTADEYLVNVAFIDATPTVRYDVIGRRDGAWLASWIETDPQFIITHGDGVFVYAIGRDVPDVVRFRATLNCSCEGGTP